MSHHDKVHGGMLHCHSLSLSGIITGCIFFVLILIYRAHTVADDEKGEKKVLEFTLFNFLLD